MKYEVIINRNSVTLTVEKITVEAQDKYEAMDKARRGIFLEIDIVEVSDVADLSSEIESVAEIPE